MLSNKVEGKVFRELVVIPDFRDGHYIQWTLDPFFNGKRPYNFTLQVSQTLDFSEILYSKSLGDVYFTRDTSGLKQSWSNNYIYKVVLTDADGKNYSSFAALFGHSLAEKRSYAMAGEIIRKEFLLSRYAGQRCWLLKRKTYGTIVTQNVDPVSGVPITDTVDQDYGVGLAEGYFDAVPISMTLEKSSEDKRIDPAGMGVKETYDLVVRIPGYPFVDARDVICTNQDGYRYSVTDRENTYFPGTNIIIVQRVSLRLIPPSDTIYSITVPLDPND